uniref:phage nozzle protein n=1 Tax=Endozoicomonas sp. SESOKO1 TaxID=2828742 RepID=UPI0021473748
VIASKLAEGMRANAHISKTFDILQDGSSILVRAKADGYNFSVKARDSLGNTAIKALKDKTQDISDLPAIGFEGFTIAIVGGGSEDEKYYVVYDNGEDSKEGGAWLETKPAGLNTRLVKTTMPHQLIAEADGSFTFCAADWSSREVGDEESNPDPSFVNQTINDVFFYRNRLGLLSGENMLFSKDGDYWNFYLTTVRTTLDSDTIDIGSTSDRVSVLRHAVTFNEQLIVFSDSVQFAPNSGAEGLLSPATITMDIITRLEAQLRAKPVGAGQTLFFGTRLGNYSGMREYFIAPEIEITSAADISGHIPTYIKGDIIELTASSSHDILVARTDDIKTNLYVYAYFWENTEKMQSSWSRWVFSGDVLTSSFIDAKLYLVVRRPEGLMLESIDMSRFNTPLSNGWQTDILLDRRTKVLTGQPFPEHLQGEPEASLVAIEKNGRAFKADAIKAKLYDAEGIAVSDHYIGLSYSFEFTFSEQVIKDNESVPANIIDRVQIQRMAVSYTDSGFFEAMVSTPFDDLRIYPFTGRIMGSINNMLNRESLESGVQTFPVNSRSDLVTIKLQSDSHLPCSFQTAEWSGVTRSKAQRVF